MIQFQYVRAKTPKGAVDAVTKEAEALLNESRCYC